MDQARIPPQQLARLRQNLIDRFSEEELRDLCFDLGVDYESLPAQGKAGKARELIAHLDRLSCIPDLIARCSQLRPQASWVDAPDVGREGAPLAASIGPNPFGDTGRITDPGRFFDRKELLRQIFEELGKGSNLSLVGESQIGKSSILSMICVWGPERLSLPSETFAYLSLEWVKNESEFYDALCDALRIEPCRGYSLTRALSGMRYVLCLDEIEKMTWKGFTQDLRSHLRGLADGAEAPLRLVIASRTPLARLFPDSPELDSPLAGICLPLDVGPFPPDVARAFLAHRLHGTGVTFAESEIAALLRETGGHPARLQRAAADLYRRHASCFTPHVAEG